MSTVEETETIQVAESKWSKWTDPQRANLFMALAVCVRRDVQRIRGLQKWAIEPGYSIDDDIFDGPGFVMAAHIHPEVVRRYLREFVTAWWKDKNRRERAKIAARLIAKARRHIPVPLPVDRYEMRHFALGQINSEWVDDLEVLGQL